MDLSHDIKANIECILKKMEELQVSLDTLKLEINNIQDTISAKDRVYSDLASSAQLRPDIVYKFENTITTKDGYIHACIFTDASLAYTSSGSILTGAGIYGGADCFLMKFSLLERLYVIHYRLKPQ